MALTLENPNLTWQRVKIYTQGASAAIVQELKALKSYLAQQKGNPNLKVTAFDVTTNGSADGNADVVASDSAGKLIAIYAKKGTGAVLAYNAIANHATAIQAQKEFLSGNTTAGTETLATWPAGLAFATGVTYASVTAYNGTTHSLKADSSNGFIIMAAA